MGTGSRMKPLDPKSLQGERALDAKRAVSSLRGLDRKTRIIGAVLLLAVGALGWWLLSNGAKPAPQPRKIAVAVAKSVVKDVPYRVEAPGSVQPVVSVAIRPRVDSMVEKVRF